MCGPAPSGMGCDVSVTLVWLQMQVPPDHVSSVRLILRQPSCVWLNFTLEDIKIYPHSSAGNPVISALKRQRGGAGPILTSFLLFLVSRIQTRTSLIGCPT